MTRRMLINARVPEELRIAIVDGDVLENYQVEVADRDLTRGNIYRGIIASIQPSLNAAFIDYGAERHGFLTVQDVVPAAYYREPEKSGRPRIDEVLEKGKPIVVQVTREPEGNKGAALTTNLSLAGRYLVLTPFDDKQGVSRKVEDEDTRKRLKEQVAKLDRPSGAGLIVRTNALDQNKAALNRDMNALLRLWKSVGQEARRGKGLQLLYRDQDIILRTLRDYLDTSIQEVLIDDEAAYDKTQQYMRAFMPRSKTRLVRYSERTPLFARFELEPQIERIYDRQVALSSGGSIVI
ncbi:MAG: ribonuclease E/G, partial [Thermoanaerobaculia bacterium]